MALTAEAVDHVTAQQQLLVNKQVPLVLEGDAGRVLRVTGMEKEGNSMPHAGKEGHAMPVEVAVHNMEDSGLQAPHPLQDGAQTPYGALATCVRGRSISYTLFHHGEHRSRDSLCPLQMGYQFSFSSAWQEGFQLNFQLIQGKKHLVYRQNFPPTEEKNSG